MKTNNAQLKYLSQSVILEETYNQNLVYMTIMVITFLITTFLVWASFTNINEVARAQGEVIPSGYVQIIQHLEGGIVRDILVQEGDFVDKNEVLSRLDGAGVQEDLKLLEVRHTSLKLQAERLKAYTENRSPQFDAITSENNHALQSQKISYEGMIEARASTIEVLDNQIKQKEHFLMTLKNQESTLEESSRISEEVLTIEEQSLSKGSNSRISLLSAQKEHNKLQGDIAKVKVEISQAEQAIMEYKNRKVSQIAEKKDEVLQELANVESLIAENEEKIQKLSNQVNRLEIRSPVKGLVKGMEIKTIGGVIGAGQTLMEVVPLNKTLIVEAQISPKDVGHVVVGQPVQVKVGSYDFSRYGAIDGTLKSVSATTFSADNGQRYYKAQINLSQNHVGPDPTKNILMPGMIVEADVITGEKSVLAYMLKPISVSLKTAFTER